MKRRMRPTSGVEAAIDALAVARLTHLLQVDEVYPLPEARAAFLRRVGDSRWEMLISCPWCLSVWVGAAVIGLRAAFPRAWPWMARLLAGSLVTGKLEELG